MSSMVIAKVRRGSATFRRVAHRYPRIRRNPDAGPRRTPRSTPKPTRATLGSAWAALEFAEVTTRGIPSWSSNLRKHDTTESNGPIDALTGEAHMSGT